MEVQTPAPQGEQGVTISSGLTSRVAPRDRIARILRESSGIVGALIILMVVGTIISPYFFQVDNLINVARQVAIKGILGVGMTYVILTSGIDLSVGAIIGFVSVIGAGLLRAGLPWPVAVLGGLTAGAFAGALNGFGVTKGTLQPFIMTLGMMVIARGVSMTISDGQPISIRAAAGALDWLGKNDFLGLPMPIWLLLIIAIISALVLTYTPFGRQIYAVGDNEEAARLSGINVKRVKFAVYVISGALAAVSALILVSRLTTGHPDQGTGFELDAIAIVVIGGTSLFGGEGSVFGTLIGAAIVAVLANLLNLVGVSPFSQQIVQGLIIIGAVLLERRKAAALERR